MFRMLLILLSLVVCAKSFADPRQWDTDGVPVRAVSIFEDFSQAEREDGTTLLVWSQSLGSNPVIMGQLIAPDGELMWNEGGLYLASAERRSGYPVALSVGNEWVIAWQDAEIIAGNRAETGWTGISALRLLRIDDQGTPVWTGGRAGVELVPVGEWDDRSPYTLHESGDGLIVTWSRTNDHWVQRIDANGQTAWPSAIRIKAQLNTGLPDVSSDMQGGIVFAWWQILSGDTILFANRLLQNGTFAWNDTSGVAVYASNQFFRQVSICGDGSGGAFVVWRVQDNNLDPRAQYINAQGAAVWNAGGVALADLSENQFIRSIAPSFQGGTLDGLLAVVNVDDAPQSVRLVAQKLLLDGTRQWGASGAVVCGDASSERYFGRVRMTSDRAGGSICYYYGYTELGANLNKLLIARIAQDGTFPWAQPCGVVLDSSLSYYGYVLAKPILTGNTVQLNWLESANLSARPMKTQRVALATGDVLYPEPIVIATGEPRGVERIKAVQLSNGSTALVWQILAGGTETLQFQILDVFGTPMFGSEGLLLTKDEQGNPLTGIDCGMCPDGSGGFFAIFRRYEGIYENGYAVHIDSQGEHVSDPVGTRLFTENSVSFQNAQCIPDGEGGCFVSALVFNEQFFLTSTTTRLDALCREMWDVPVTYDSDQLDVLTVNVVQSENGSCILVYSSAPWGNIGVWAARISREGEEVWNVPIDTAAFGYRPDYAACADRANGVYVVWAAESEDGLENQTRLQNISSSGEKLWGEDGLTIADTVFQAEDFSCDADPLGNLTIAWHQFNGNDMDILAQRFSRSGDTRWPEGGLMVSDAPRYQLNPKVIVLSDNEVYIVWHDERSNVPGFYVPDIYATHLNARGELGDDSYWQENGSPVCNYDYSQSSPVAVADGAGGVIVAWYDQRTSFDWDNSVFAQRLYDPIFTEADDAPVVPAEFSLSQNYPNPFNPTTEIEFALPTVSNAKLKIYDVTGRLVSTLVNETLTAGTHRVSFDAARLPSGVYLYNLTTGQHSLTRKMVLLR